MTDQDHGREARFEAWLYDAGVKPKPEFGTPIYERETMTPNLAHPDGMRFKLIGEPGRHISTAKQIGLIIEIPDNDNVVETFPKVDAAIFRLSDHYNLPMAQRLPRPIEEEPEADPAEAPADREHQAAPDAPDTEIEAVAP